MDSQNLSTDDSLRILLRIAGLLDAGGEVGSAACFDTFLDTGFDASSEVDSFTGFDSECYAGPDDGSNSGNGSNSSTLVYDHEPFATFQSRVQELAQKKV
ncbi:hypothetical protein F5B17DRAFT_424153 [Nemania serpens]|nr:hypothetical protein F5B17DRAFT_424153 [Nemania serpens]